MNGAKLNIFKQWVKSIKEQKLNDIGLSRLYIPEKLSQSVLGLEDKDENQLALYETEYVKLRDYLKKLPDPIPINDFVKLSTQRKCYLLEAAQVKTIKYFSASNLAKCELNPLQSNFSKKGDICDQNGRELPKNAHQNCVIMQNNKIYIHPKMRSQLGNIGSEVMFNPDETSLNPGLIGVSHSSLASNSNIQFAGCLDHDETRGWVIKNQSGHYLPQPYQLKIFLEKLSELGVPLNKLTVQIFVAKTGRPTPYYSDDKYESHFENAQTLLDNIRNSSKAALAALKSDFSDQSESDYTTDDYDDSNSDSDIPSLR
ncbi:hypothetical protein N9Q05_00615 [bacterium]|nr:hypothetical protein [bacterium]